jgi:hypothetical protein
MHGASFEHCMPLVKNFRSEIYTSNRQHMFHAAAIIDLLTPFRILCVRQHDDDGRQHAPLWRIFLLT